MTLVLADVTGLRRLDESKSDLLATVSHEFKTRLTSFRMAVHLLLDEKVGDLNPRQAELVLAAREDAENLHRLIEGLLDIGRIRAGRLRMEMKPMPAEELMIHAVDAVRHAYQDKGLHLEQDLPADLPAVLADPSRVHLILDNLLSNALKYTSAGGSVKVTVDADGDSVAFRVADTGAGIPAADLPKIFERFYRGARERDGGGAGLGLAIAREVVEAHGGRISAESAEGRGSIFTFTLRRADRAAPDVASQDSERSMP
jgi:signal transduction histidine kinase